MKSKNLIACGIALATFGVIVNVAAAVMSYAYAPPTSTLESPEPRYPVKVVETPTPTPTPTTIETPTVELLRFPTVEAYFSAGNPNPLTRLGYPLIQRDVSSSRRRAIIKRDGGVLLHLWFNKKSRS